MNKELVDKYIYLHISLSKNDKKYLFNEFFD